MSGDQFETYFAEKLWAMMPAIYREEDALAEQPGTLRALVEVLASQAAVLRRSQDQLWDDQFIDLCSDWAVPYLADLLRTRLVSAANARGRRVDVAKTIYYRRRKGTPRILEELISDITGWEGRMVESFRRLLRARHGLDPSPQALAGEFTGTAPGGIADLRRPRAAEMAGTAFDEFHYTPDFRRAQGRRGSYGIPKLNFHLYRLRSYLLEGVDPFSLGDGQRFTFDPSGRSIPLFALRNRQPDWEAWRPALPWELPVPISCRLLGHVRYVLDEEVVQRLVAAPGLSVAAQADLRRLGNRVFRDEGQLADVLETLPTQVELLAAEVWLPLLTYALIDGCGKGALLAESAYRVVLPLAQRLQDEQGLSEVAADELRSLYGRAFPTEAALRAAIDLLTNSAELLAAPMYEALLGYTLEVSPLNSLAVWPANAPFGLNRAQVAAGGLADWSAQMPAGKLLKIDPDRGRCFFTEGPEPALPSVAYAYGFSGELGAGGYDRRHSLAAEADAEISGGGEIVAASILNGGVTQVADSRSYGTIGNKLSINYLSLQAANFQRPYLRMEENWILSSGTNTNAELNLNGLWLGAEAGARCILRGNFERVLIQSCTFDPGGDTDALGNEITACPLVIEGFVELLCIERSIMAQVQLGGEGFVENLLICDSVVQSVAEATPAIELPGSSAQIFRTTVMGQTFVKRLSASDSLFTGLTEVLDAQQGCFRFSAAAPGSRVAKPYRSYFLPDAAHWFASKRFGQPGYAQLSATVPTEIASGAENANEMGAFNHLVQATKLHSLNTKIDEYMPFGLIPNYIFET